MKKYIVFTILTVIALCSVASAMTLDASSITLVTTDPNSQPFGWGGSFAICHPNQMTVWTDSRDPNFMEAVYGVRFNDPPYKEFPVDLEAVDSTAVAANGHILAYPIWPPTVFQGVRIVDISDVNSPVQVDIVQANAGIVDVSGSLVAMSFTDPDTWLQSVVVLDVSDFSNITKHPIATLTSDEGLYGLAIDGSRLVLAVENWSTGSYVQIADITDINAPAFSTAYLPAETSFSGIDVSGEWLVAAGQVNNSARVFAVQNYTDVNNWNTLTLWRGSDDSESLLGSPRIDGPIAVWTVNTSLPSLIGLNGRGDTQWRLKSAYLNPRGSYALATLRSVTWSLDAAEIIGDTVVWSENPSKIGLYKGTILIGCGDWGYEYGDLNRDCYVDFKDFAIFAEGWLHCTLPGGTGCGYGLAK